MAQGAVLGIDVGYSESRPATCFCLLVWSEGTIRISLIKAGVSEQERVLAINRLFAEPTHCAAVAIDGPLTRGLRRITHYRVAEALLSRGLFQKRGKAGQTSAPVGLQLHEHATRLAHLILAGIGRDQFSVALATHIEPISEYAIVEAFPNAFLAAVIDEPSLPALKRDASDRYWEHLAGSGSLSTMLRRLLPPCDAEISEMSCEITKIRSSNRAMSSLRTLDEVSGHDERAAVVCAFTALALATETGIGVGDPEYGDIFLPPLPLWGASRSGSRPWVETCLRKNIATTANDRKIANHDAARARLHRRYWLPKEPENASR